MKTAIILLVILVTALPASADTFILDNPLWVSQWADGQSTNYCWVASAAELLAWGGYATPAYPTVQAIYNMETEYFPNVGGDPDTAISWYLSQTWPSLQVSDVLSESYSGNVAFASANILSGIPAIIAVGSHTLAMWGFSYDPSATTGIYVTDSGAVTQMIDGQWHLASDLWYYPLDGPDHIATSTSNIYQAWALKPNQVPEPASLFLVGLGLIWLLTGFRKQARSFLM